jgi:uncharacterized membrane protein
MAAPIWPVGMAGVAYAVGSMVCHQIASRSFHLGSAQMAVCARCAGIYVGLATCVAAAAINGGGWRFTDRWSPRHVVLAGLAPMAATVALEWSGAWSGTNDVRFVTGLVCGAAVAGVVVGAVATVDYQRA